MKLTENVIDNASYEEMKTMLDLFIAFNNVETSSGIKQCNLNNIKKRLDIVLTYIDSDENTEIKYGLRAYSLYYKGHNYIYVYNPKDLSPEEINLIAATELCFFGLLSVSMYYCSSGFIEHYHFDKKAALNNQYLAYDYNNSEYLANDLNKVLEEYAPKLLMPEVELLKIYKDNPIEIKDLDHIAKYFKVPLDVAKTRTSAFLEQKKKIILPKKHH